MLVTYQEMGAGGLDLRLFQVRVNDDGQGGDAFDRVGGAAGLYRRLGDIALPATNLIFGQ